MKRPDTATVFAGVDARTATHLPEWYDQQHAPDRLPSFAEAIRDLPRAVDVDVAYKNPYSEEWVETDRFNAIADPDRLAEQTHDESVDALFNIPTDSYAVITPKDVYGPFEEVLRATEYDGERLGDVVFGQIRQYRGGGEVHMDVLFDGLSVSLPGRREPITLGVSSGYDYFGGHAVYVEGFAQDTYCANSIRALTDRLTVKHVGDVEEFGEWWEGILAQLELVSDDLVAFIQEAQDISIDLSAVPFDLPTFYELLGFPEYLARQAASDARAEAPDPVEIDMWTLHSGATYALTHAFTGKEGAAMDGYVQLANDILFNPEATIDRLHREYETQATTETAADGQTDLASQVALAQLDRVSSDVREKATQFEQREMALRERFA